MSFETALAAEEEDVPDSEVRNKAWVSEWRAKGIGFVRPRSRGTHALSVGDKRWLVVCTTERWFKPTPKAPHEGSGLSAEVVAIPQAGAEWEP